MRLARLPEADFLADPTLWTSAGLAAWLMEQGVDATQPFVRMESEHALTWLQSDDAELLGYYVGFYQALGYEATAEA